MNVVSGISLKEVQDVVVVRRAKDVLAVSEGGNNWENGKMVRKGMEKS